MSRMEEEKLEGCPVHVEVCKKAGADDRQVREMVLDLLAMQEAAFVTEGPVMLEAVPGLSDHVDSVVVEGPAHVPKWEANFILHTFSLSEEGPYDETTEEDPNTTVYTLWELPCKQFNGLWESLMYESDVKDHLLEFASTSLLFSAMSVDKNIVSWNHVVLLHGPPGTGKTSLCQALAQKLSIRLSDTFRQCKLLEINSHSLFSKWFSESGKLVSNLFSNIHELAEEEDTLVCILIDEVESLAAARGAALAGSEPSDSIRVVNALLTQIDRLKTRKNVMVLTTSNITEAIDIAFVDRADIRQFIGLPPEVVRRNIIHSCLQELQRAGLVVPSVSPCEEETFEQQLAQVAKASEGLSGRALRKLPFQAHARFIRKPKASTAEFLQALLLTCQQVTSEISRAQQAKKQ